MSPERPRSTIASSPAADASLAPPDGGPEALLPPPFARWAETHRVTPHDPKDLCEVADSNIEHAGRAILAASSPQGPRPPLVPWDKKGDPSYLGLVARRYALTAAEKRILAREGFVVLERLGKDGFTRAFHSVYQAQLPIYVSIDSILHSVYQSNDVLIARAELDTLLPRETNVLDRMHAELKVAAASYPPEVARDLDVYLTVARSLLGEEGKNVPSALGTDTESASLIDKAQKASGLETVSLFGRSRVVDFSQYAPRGHYASFEEGALKAYFRASVWLSRLELNLVSRASRSSTPGVLVDPRETPREAVDALALTDLAGRAHVMNDIALLDQTWGAFAGKREDASFADLAALRVKGKITTLSIPDSAERLIAAIGTDFERTTRVHYMPQGSTPLPAIATMLGPRIVPDTTAAELLVHGAIPGRDLLGAADIGFLLGHDRAKAYLKQDLKAFPTLGSQLDAGRALLAQKATTKDMYNAWFSAARALSQEPSGALPSFMKTEAFHDLRFNSAIAAYGQIRHNYVLIAGQAYDEGGCEIPEGYVEPALGVYDALLEYAARGAAVEKMLAQPAGEAYFAKLTFHLRVLRAIVVEELANRPLSEDAKRYLSMVVEIRPPSSDGPGSNDGWYFDLFAEGGAFADEGFIADYYTSSNAETVVYAGATAPRMGLFVVDTGGPPRVMVGPVARAFEARSSLAHRLNDQEAAKLKTLSDPWARSYTAPALPAPPLVIASLSSAVENESVFLLKSTRAIGTVTVELLDHHGVPVSRGSASVGSSFTRVRVKMMAAAPADASPEILRVRVGDYATDLGTIWSSPNLAIGGMKQMSYEDVEKFNK
jgi:hypothetical protein